MGGLGQFGTLAGLGSDVETGADQGSEAQAALANAMQPSGAAAPAARPAAGGAAPAAGGYDPLSGIQQLMGSLNQMPGTPQVPAAANVQQRHGGVLTGLVGVLLDGLASGMAPTTQQAWERPQQRQQLEMQRQQQQMQMQEQQMRMQQAQQEMALAPLKAKYEMMQTAVNMMYADQMYRGLKKEHQIDVLGVGAKFMQQQVDDGLARLDATAPDLQGAQALARQRQAQNQDTALNFAVLPTKWDDQENPTEYGVYESYPKDSLQKPFHHVLMGDKDLKIPDKVIDIPAGTLNSEAHLKVSTDVADQGNALKLETERMQSEKMLAAMKHQATMEEFTFRRLTDQEKKDALSNDPAAIMNIGRMLVEGEVEPTQVGKLGSRSGTQTALYNAADQYSRLNKGVPFDAEKAQRDWNYANQKSTQDTLNMIRGMAEPGGSMDIVKDAAKSLPALPEQTINNVFNRVATEFGSSQESDFHTAMVGFADEYAKVMGGGVGAVQNVDRGMSILKSNYAKGQIESGIQILQKDIQARVHAMVGDNPYLRKTYGGLIPGGGPTAGGAAAAAPAKPNEAAKYGGVPE